MIKLQIIGNIGRDAQVNEVNGKKVINFSVAHTESWKDSTGEKKTKTTWVAAAHWTEKTGIVPYLKKGTMVYVEGLPEAKSYTASDGSAKADLHVRVVSIQLLSVAKEDSGGSVGTAAPVPTGHAVNSDEHIGAADDLPF